MGYSWIIHFMKLFSQSNDCTKLVKKTASTSIDAVDEQATQDANENYFHDLFSFDRIVERF